jgi:hypothetical protein
VAVSRSWIAAGILVPLFSSLLALGAADDFFAFFGKADDFKQLPRQTKQNHEFTFVRLIYNGRIPSYLKNWYTDYPSGDRNLVKVLSRLTDIDIAPESRAVPIHDPDLYDYPMIYSAEGGQMRLSSNDARIMREYTDRGGFWMIDDFWGSLEWSAFAQEMKKVFPDRPIVEVPREHPVFHNFFDIEETLQVPNIGYAYCYGGCSTAELDGDIPYVRGIFDGMGRLSVLIYFNTDLMDASEWADDPRYPHKFSSYAYKVFANAVVYSMSH